MSFIVDQCERTWEVLDGQKGSPIVPGVGVSRDGHRSVAFSTQRARYGGVYQEVVRLNNANNLQRGAVATALGLTARPEMYEDVPADVDLEYDILTGTTLEQAADAVRAALVQTANRS